MPPLEVAVFWVSAVVAVGSGIGVIAAPAPVYSAMALIVTLANLAILYLLLNAQFIAAAQVIIYAGAVMVLFLFVITLLGVRDYSLFGERQPAQRYAAILLGALILAAVIFFVARSPSALTGTHGNYNALVAREGNAQAFGRKLFNDFVLPFEVTPFLLIVAMVGAVALGRSGDVEMRRRGQDEPAPAVSEPVASAPIGSTPVASRPAETLEGAETTAAGGASE